MLSFSETSRGVTVDLDAHYWAYSAPQTSRIMPLGDSITSGFNSPPEWGYRGPLWNLLTQGGAKIDYLGDFQDGPASLPDRDHQGTLYQTADELVPLIPGLMSQYKPDIVLLMIGSNDIEGGDDPSNLRSELSQILDGIAATLPNTTVYLSTLTPLSPDRPGSDVIPLANNEIRAAIAEARGEGQRVRLVDANLTLSDLVDGVHPNASGNAKLAQAWFNAMIGDDPALGGRKALVSGGETTVYGSDVSDRLLGNKVANHLDGRGGNDLVYGKGGEDRLYGGAGNDSLAGGTGRDVLIGGTGDDRFIFTSRSDSGKTSNSRDVVWDFRKGDKVDLSQIDANTTKSGNQAFVFVSSFTHKPGQLQWDKTSKGFVVSGDVNGDGHGDFSVQVNTTLRALHSFDFVL